MSMTEQQAEAFAEAVLDRVAKLAYDELRPHLDAYLAKRTRKTSSAAWSSTSGAMVLPLDRARSRRAG
ncbi:hypothetical protein [Micromonospora sp. NPDC005161]